MKFFNRILIVFTSFYISVLCCFGQEKNVKDSLPLFSNGVYVENLQINIPWTLDLSDLSVYGNPKIVRQTRTRSNLIWDSVKILNGIEVKMSCFVDNRLLDNKGKSVHEFVRILLNDADFDKVKSFFTSYTGQINQVHGTNNEKGYFYWMVNSSTVRLGRDKSNGSFLLIERPSPKHGN